MIYKTKKPDDVASLWSQMFGEQTLHTCPLCGLILA